MACSQCCLKILILVLYGLLPVSLFIQIIRFVYRWKELVQAERTGQFPDLENINNDIVSVSICIDRNIAACVWSISICFIFKAGWCAVPNDISDALGI